MRRSIIIMFALMPVLAMAHPIHVSVCEMNHNRADKVLDITIKIFADDFQDVLEERTGESIDIGLETEHPKTDAYIFDYLKEKLILSVNGKPRVIEFSHKEVEDVAAWCYLSIPDISEIATITISNNVMLHWFKDQVNVVHLDCNDKLNSTFFSSGRQEETFTFK